MAGARDAVAQFERQAALRAARAQSLDETIARFQAEHAEAETALIAVRAEHAGAAGAGGSRRNWPKRDRLRPPRVRPPPRRAPRWTSKPASARAANADWKAWSAITVTGRVGPRPPASAPPFWTPTGSRPPPPSRPPARRRLS